MSGKSPRKKNRLAPAQTRASLESFNWNAALRSVYDTVCGGTTIVFVGFALSLGLAKERMGLVTTVISCACVLQLLGLMLANTVRDKKRYVITLALVEPAVLIAVVLLVPWLPPGLRLWALAAAVFVAAGSLHLTRPFSDNWVASVIPAGIRGRYLGRRFQAVSVFVIVATLAAGYAMERVGKENTVGLGVLLAAGGVFGILSVLALRPAHMPELVSSTRVTWRDLYGVFRVKGFRRYMMALAIYNFPFLFAVPYYQVFNLRILEMRASTIAYMTVGYFIMRIIATPFCGRFIDAVGERRAALICGPMYALFFLAFPLCSVDRVWPLMAAWAFVGLADAVYVIALTSALYKVVPEVPSRPAFFAVSNLFTLGAYGVGAFVAVPLLERLKHVPVRTVGPMLFDQFRFFYAGCGVVMFAAAFGALFLTGREASAKSR